MLKISVKKSGPSRFISSVLERNATRQRKSRKRKRKGEGMPKRVGNLYQRFSDRDFVKTVILMACKGKTKRREVRRILADPDGYAEKLCTMLETGAYKPRKPSVSLKYDDSSQKWRTIRTLPFFPDCCIQWLVVEVLKQPVFMRGMDPYSSASIPGRGGRHIYKKLKHQLTKKRKASKYAFQCDIHHYYDNINITLLMKKLRRRCKDERVLKLIEDILRTTASDDIGETGLCIGFYMNQWLANFYIEDSDRMIRNHKASSCYTRYMDNMTILSGNKRKLRKLRMAIEEKLKELRLELKSDWQIYPTRSRSVQAVGYRFYASGAVRIRKRSWLKMRRRFLRVRAKQKAGLYIPKRMARGILSRFGNLKHLNSSRKIMREYVPQIDFADIRRIAA